MPTAEEEEEWRVAVLRRAKVALRSRLRALRNTTPASACAKRSELIVGRLLAMDEIARAASIALFFPIEERHEVDLRAFDTALRARGGIEIAYPAIDEESHAMTFRIAAPGDLVRDPLGFLAAPNAAREPASIGVVVVPSIALDDHGRRLGYGAGFYDRALARFTSAMKIGVAYDFQLLAEVPSLPNDIAMDFIVTDTRTLRAER